MNAVLCGLRTSVFFVIREATVGIGCRSLFGLFNQRVLSCPVENLGFNSMRREIDLMTSSILSSEHGSDVPSLAEEAV